MNKKYLSRIVLWIFKKCQTHVKFWEWFDIFKEDEYLEHPIKIINNTLTKKTCNGKLVIILS